MPHLCVDIGATNTLLGVGEDGFDAVEQVGTAAFLDDIPGHVDAVVDGPVDSVAVAAAGPIDRAAGTFRPPNLARDAVQVVAPLKRYADTVRFFNDCNAAVRAEHAASETDDLVYLTISSGIGAGVVLDGCLLEGATGNTGEVGHIRVAEDGLPCGCGGRGHWEAHCSGNNLPRMARALFDAEFADARALFRAYRDGDADAARVVDRMQALNAVGIGAIVDVYDPAVIRLGGGVALHHDDIILDGLMERVDRDTINHWPEIGLAHHGKRAVLEGLLLAAEDQ